MTAQRTLHYLTRPSDRVSTSPSVRWVLSCLLGCALEATRSATLRRLADQPRAGSGRSRAR